MKVKLIFKSFENIIGYWHGEIVASEIGNLYEIIIDSPAPWYFLRHEFIIL